MFGLLLVEQCRCLEFLRQGVEHVLAVVGQGDKASSPSKLSIAQTMLPESGGDDAHDEQRRVASATAKPYV